MSQTSLDGSASAIVMPLVLADTRSTNLRLPSQADVSIRIDRDDSNAQWNVTVSIADDLCVITQTVHEAMVVGNVCVPFGSNVPLAVRRFTNRHPVVLL
jgi:hypothetical protein